MSTDLNINPKKRSFSPSYLHTQSPNETSPLFTKHKELIRQTISELPNSPKSKAKLEQTLEDLLKSVHYFQKPDIIPYPYPDFSSSESKLKLDLKLQEALNALAQEQKQRTRLENENENLKQRLASLLEIESKYEEYRIKALKLTETNNEVEKLNIRIKILLDENQELRKKVKIYDAGLGNKGIKELEIEKELNLKLKQQLIDTQEAYDELRQTYMQDVDSQRSRFQKLYSEKNLLDKEIRDIKGNKVFNDSIQERIKDMKNQYLEKLKQLEERIETERMQTGPKEDGEKSGNFKGRLGGKGKNDNGMLFNADTPKTEKFRVECGDGDRLNTSPRRVKRSRKCAEDKGWKRGSQKGLCEKSERIQSKSRSRSPNSAFGSSKSPSARRDCQTCIKRHGHEWAKSPDYGKHNFS